MNSVSSNKNQFKVYLKNAGMANNTINTYCTALNRKITTAIRDLCNVDLGSIFAVINTRLLTYWLKTLKDKKEFNILNSEWNDSPHAAFKKYIEYIKHLSRQSE